MSQYSSAHNRKLHCAHHENSWWWIKTILMAVIFVKNQVVEDIRMSNIDEEFADYVSA